jgi:hypothetical protein
MSAPTVHKRRIADDGEDEEEEDHYRPMSRPSTNPPSSPEPGPSSSGAEDNYDDMDLDALLASEAHNADADAFLNQYAPKPAPKRPVSSGKDDAGDDAMWDMLDGMDAQPQPAAKKRPWPPAQDEMDDDEDLWDAVREAEQEVRAPPVVKPLSAQTIEARRKADEEEWESMYA